MKKTLLFILAVLLITTSYGQKLSKNKKAVIASIENHDPDLINLSDKIWAEAEIAFEEINSSKILSGYAEKNGFTIQKGVAGMPTAFVAS